MPRRWARIGWSPTISAIFCGHTSSACALRAKPRRQSWRYCGPMPPEIGPDNLISLNRLTTVVAPVVGTAHALNAPSGDRRQGTLAQRRSRRVASRRPHPAADITCPKTLNELMQLRARRQTVAGACRCAPSPRRLLRCDRSGAARRTDARVRGSLNRHGNGARPSHAIVQIVLGPFIMNAEQHFAGKAGRNNHRDDNRIRPMR